MKDLLAKTSSKMEHRIDHLESDFASIRAGRANPAVLDKVMVDYYGSPTPIQQVAAVSITEARTLIIQPWDISILRDIEKAIQTSDVGINPQNDGKVLRMIFPPLTEERRKEIVKEIKEMSEETKVQIRNARRDAIDDLKKMKKSGDITEDDLKQGEKEIQDITNKYSKEIDSLSDVKQKEILAI